MTMAANNRANPRSPGRTPPFILVGLIVLVGFLGFNYWSLSSTNSDLSAQLEKVNVQRRDVEQKNAEVEKNLEISREELRQVQGNLDQTNKQLSERDSELNNAKKDYSDKLVELDELRKTLEKCDSGHGEDMQQLDSLKAEKVQLEQQLTEEKNKAPPPCDVGKCLGPVKEIITIVSKLVGTEAMSKALQDANLDPSQLMEGIPQIPPPQPQQNVDQNQQQQQQQPQQQNPPQNNPNPPQGNESEGKGEPKKDEAVKEMSVDDNAVENPKNESDKANGSLMYQPGKEEELKEESEKEGQIDENNAQEEKEGESDATLNKGEEVEEDGDNYETGNEEEEEEEEEGVTGNTPTPGQNTQDYGADDDEDGTAYDNEEEEEEGEEGDNDAGELDYQQGEGGNK